MRRHASAGPGLPSDGELGYPSAMDDNHLSPQETLGCTKGGNHKARKAVEWRKHINGKKTKTANNENHSARNVKAVKKTAKTAKPAKTAKTAKSVKPVKKVKRVRPILSRASQLYTKSFGETQQTRLFAQMAPSAVALDCEMVKTCDEDGATRLYRVRSRCSANLSTMMHARFVPSAGDRLCNDTFARKEEKWTILSSSGWSVGWSCRPSWTDVAKKNSGLGLHADLEAQDGPAAQAARRAP